MKKIIFSLLMAFDDSNTTCSIDNNNSILNQFIADPNMIESACISIDCECP